MNYFNWIISLIRILINLVWFFQLFFLVRFFVFVFVNCFYIVLSHLFFPDCFFFRSSSFVFSLLVFYVRLFWFLLYRFHFSSTLTNFCRCSTRWKFYWAICFTLWREEDHKKFTLSTFSVSENFNRDFGECFLSDLAFRRTSCYFTASSLSEEGIKNHLGLCLLSRDGGQLIFYLCIPIVFQKQTYRYLIYSIFTKILTSTYRNNTYARNILTRTISSLREKNCWCRVRSSTFRTNLV